MKADSWPAKETLRLAKLQSYHILDTLAEPVYDDIVELAAQICQVPTALISLIDANRQWFKARVGLSVSETPRKVAFCNFTIEQSELLIVEDAHRDPRFKQNPLVTGNPHIRFYAGAPLITPDGHSLGSLCVIDFKPRRLSSAQLRGLTVLSRQVVTQMELSRQARQLKSSNEHLEERVKERTATLTSALHRLLKAQKQLVKREAALRHSALHDPLTGLPNRSYFSQRLEQSIQLTNRQPDHLYAVLFIDLDHFKPVNDTFGHEVGDRLLQRVAKQIKFILRKSDLLARLGGDEFAVLLDDIPNENHAITVVKRLQRQIKKPFMIEGRRIFIGASVGITFSSRGYRQAEAALRDADVAMYHAKREAKQQAREALQAQIAPLNPTLNSALDSTSSQPNLPPDLRSSPAATTPSPNLSPNTSPNPSPNPSPIMVQPNHSAVIQRFKVFNSTLQAGDQARLTLEDELHQALQQNQFHWYYQPIFDLISGQLLGLEGLLRWHHPQRGCLEAKDFIAIAEEMGIIRQLYQQTIQTACAQIKRWREHPDYGDLTMHLNVSFLQMTHPEMLAQWQARLAEHQLPPSACQLEIEEQVLLSNDPTVMAGLQTIQTIGLGLCVDDFGRGHSSLSRLHQLDVHTIKIDRAFVEALTVEALTVEDGSDIVKTIIDLGRSANLAVIAEGIETPEQLEVLIAMGCRMGQGFWLCEPLSAIALNQVLSERQ
jgi:diguanylate cyclase (GGDEF)-like protein